MLDGTRSALIASWDVAPIQPSPATPPSRPDEVVPAATTAEPRCGTIDARLAALAEAAERAMANDRLYRRDDLAIAVLARHLGCPEYQLRRAINGGLGHRNFSDFVHTWRLREAAQRLQSRAFDDQSILEVALEVGFASIGPFNRAFKARFGTTPSEFRARGAASAD
jgi:AraC-like DNA-binding protein